MSCKWPDRFSLKTNEPTVYDYTNNFKARFKRRQIIRLHVGRLFEGLSARYTEQFYITCQGRIETVHIGINLKSLALFGVTGTYSVFQNNIPFQPPDNFVWIGKNSQLKARKSKQG